MPSVPGPASVRTIGPFLGGGEIDRGMRVPVTVFVRVVARAGHADQVLELLLTNPRRVEAGEPGNVVFGVHRSTRNPNEFWLYETWRDRAALAGHQRGAPYRAYREALEPLLEPDSGLEIDTVPVTVLGYPLP